MKQVKIITCPPSLWKEYREIRLEALRTEPQAFAETYDEVEELSDQVWISRLTNSDIANIRLVLQTPDGKFVGMMTLVRSRDKKDKALIINVYISKQYRGQGFGKKMLEEIISKLKKAKDIKEIELTVNVSQVAAYNLYKILGFEVTQVLKDNIECKGELFDEYLMVKKNI